MHRDTTGWRRGIFSFVTRSGVIVPCIARLLLAGVALWLAGCQALSGAPDASAVPPQYQLAAGASESVTLKTDDELTLFGQWWLPRDAASATAAPRGAVSTATPRGVVLLVHGTFIHSGYYDPWASYLAQNGYAVFGVDLRGWGQSQGFGRRGYVLGMRQYAGDVALAYDHVKARFPATPVFMQGESLGGVVALLMQQNMIGKAVPLDGLVLNAPAVRLGPSIGPVREPYWMFRYSMWLLGFHGDPFPNFPMLYHGRAAELAVNFSLQDESLVRAYKADPLVTHTALPARYFVEVHRGGLFVQERLADVQVPVLITHGGKDNLVPVSSSEVVMRGLSSADKTLKVYPDMMHATLHDTGKERVWQDILQWLDTHRATGS